MEQKYEDEGEASPPLLEEESVEIVDTPISLPAAFLPVDRFMNPWKIYDKLLVSRLPRDAAVALFDRDTAFLKDSYGRIKDAMDTELNALSNNRKRIIADFLRSGPFSAGGKSVVINDPSSATFESLQEALITQYPSPSSSTEEQIGALESIQWFFRAIGPNSAEFMKLNDLYKTLQFEVSALPSLPVSSTRLRLLAIFGRHPTIAFLVQCAVDEIISNQATLFLDKRKPLSEHEQAAIHTAFYLYLLSHRQTASLDTVFSDFDNTDLDKTFVQCILRWHLFWLPVTHPKSELLIGFMPSEQAKETPHLFDSEMANCVYLPGILRHFTKHLSRSDPTASAVEMIANMQRFFVARLPQLVRAFPYLTACDDSSSTLVYFTSKTTLKGPRSVDYFSPEAQVFAPSKYLENAARLDFALQQKVFNHTIPGVGMHCFHTLPAIVCIKSDKGSSSNDSFACRLGPSFETGKFGEYQLFARYTLEFDSCKLLTADNGVLKDVRFSGSAYKSSQRSETVYVFSRIK